MGRPISLSSKLPALFAVGASTIIFNFAEGSTAFCMDSASIARYLVSIHSLVKMLCTDTVKVFFLKDTGLMGPNHVLNVGALILPLAASRTFFHKAVRSSIALY